MNETTLFCDDGDFGPIIRGCRQDFDFTLAFQQYIFSVVPSALLLLIAPLRLAILRRQSAKVDGSILKNVKLSLIAVFSALQLTLLVLWASRQHVQGHRRSALASACLSFAASLAILPLSHMEHVRSLRPSLLVTAYLLVCCVLDVATLRTLWLSPGTDTVLRSTFTVSFVIKVFLLALEAVQKSRFFLAAFQKRSPEESSGLFGQGLMWWLNSIIFFGARHTLKPKQLYPITADMSSEKLSIKFHTTWARNGEKSLKKTLFRLLWWPILLPALPRLALLAFTLCQPLLIRRLLELLQDESPNRDEKTGYGLIGAAVLIYAGMAVSGAVYWHRHYRFMAMVRGTLTTAVYRKALQMNMTASTSAKTITLMSADCERITRGLMDLHELWANVTQVALATWLIETQLGVACVAPVAVTLVTTGLTAYAAKYTPGFMMQWIESLESRIAVTSSILGSMKAIKITNLTSDVLSLLNKLRNDELAAGSRFRFISIITATVGYVPQLISPVLTFAAFSAIAKSSAATLDPARLFTSLSLLLLIAEPLFNLFAGLIEFMTALGCLTRLEQYLLKPPRVDNRKIMLASDDIEKSQSNPKALGARSKNGQACISVQDGTFGWEDESQPILRHLNFTINAGDIVFLQGPVGCGKSTLLKALLGETPVSNSSITLSHLEIAFCEQSPWIMNKSIRSNIIYPSPFDAELYSTVIRCCSLGPDLASLDRGDMTVVGSKGFSLSAGQRQRVALARAVYSRKSITLLDDVFSQLDADTSSSIASNLIGPDGLYRRWGTTVFIATSSTRFLSYATQTIVLDAQGEIVEQVAADTKLGLKYTNYNPPKEQSELFGAEIPIAHDSAAISEDSKVVGVKSESEEADVTEPTPEKLQESDFTVFKYYFAFINWKRAAIFLLFQACLAFLSSFPVVWLKWWTDENPSFRDNRSAYYIGVYAALQSGALVASGLVTWWTLNVLAVATGFQLHETLANTVTSSTLKLFSLTDSGSILNRFTQDIQLADIQLPLSLQVVVTNLLVGIAQAGLIASASGWIALSYPPLLAVFYLIPKYYVRTARQMRALDLEEKAPLYGQFLETLEGMATLRAFSWLHESTQQNYELVDRSQKPFYLMYVIQKWLGLVLDLALAGLVTVVVGVAIALRDTISAGSTGVALTQLVSFTSYLKMMILFWAQLQTAMAAVERIRAFSNDTERENDPEPRVEPPANWPTEGKIEIYQMSAKYISDANKATLDAVSLAFNAGEKIGICGRTGSGKSSLVLVLLRLLDPFEGHVKIDGLDIASISQDLVRSRIVGVAEEPFFFPGTVRLNLDPAGNSTDDQLVQALADVNLWSVFEKDGLDSMIDRTKLSHGQGQLFSVARALLREAKVYIFDEISSSLNAEAEKTVNRLIATRLKHCTVISVVHKMESALGFQKVAVMDQGRVDEFDDPQVLMARSSKFRELCEAEQLTSI